MKRILFVDDDPTTLQVIGLMLNGRGYRVITALSGDEALKTCQDDLPDLVLLDIMMPMMDGYEVCRQMRTDPRTSHIPVVMLSAKADMESQAEAFRCGADGYLAKPVRSSELVAHIENALERAIPAPAPVPRGIAIGIVGSQDGLGTTMVAVNVAVALAAERQVVVVDFVPAGAVNVHLGLEATHGIGALLSRPLETIKRDALLAEMVSHSSGLRALGGTANPALNLDVYRARAILSELLDIAAVTVVDLGGGLGPAARAVLPACGAVALVFGSDRVALTQVQRLLAALREVGVAEEALLPVCVNHWGVVGKLGEATAAANLGRSPYAVIDYAARELYQAIQEGAPLVLSAPESPAAQALQALAQGLYRAAQESAQKEARQ